MYRKFATIIFLLPGLFSCLYIKAQDSLITVKKYSVGYNTDKRVDIILNKCLPGSVFFIRVTNGQGKSSPADCSSGVLFNQMTVDDFHHRVKKLIIDNNILVDDAAANKIIAEDLFNRQPNFLYDLDNIVFADIKDRLKPLISEPAKSSAAKTKKIQKKKEVSETNAAEPDNAQNDEDNNDDADKADSSKININNITFFNAANFSFSGKLSANYLGLLNIFAPSIKETRWGFNTGIQKINYSNADSNSIQYYQDNVLLHPLDTIKDGTRYLRQFNKYTVATANSIWSFYFQPLFRITEPVADDPKVGIYAHAHMELLIAKWSVSTEIERISQDTAVMTGTRGAVFSSLLPDKVVSNKTFLNGYFGAGLTFYLDPFDNDNSRFFFQPTIGWTTNYPNPASIDIESNPASSIISSARPSRTQSYVASHSWNGFYLVKAKFIQALSPKMQLVIGTEMRGLFPRFAPQYAAFLGLNLDLNELAKLLSAD